MPRLIAEHAGCYTIYGRGHGKDGTFIQTDWDHPSVAREFGWSLYRVQKRNGKTVTLTRRPKAGCEHNGTDGTVDCRECGVTASDFIEAAGYFLDSIAE